MSTHRVTPQQLASASRGDGDRAGGLFLFGNLDGLQKNLETEMRSAVRKNDIDVGRKYAYPEEWEVVITRGATKKVFKQANGRHGVLPYIPQLKLGSTLAATTDSVQQVIDWLRRLARILVYLELATPFGTGFLRRHYTFVVDGRIAQRLPSVKQIMAKPNIQIGITNTAEYSAVHENPRSKRTRGQGNVQWSQPFQRIVKTHLRNSHRYDWRLEFVNAANLGFTSKSKRGASEIYNHPVLWVAPKGRLLGQTNTFIKRRRRSLKTRRYRGFARNRR